MDDLYLPDGWEVRKLGEVANVIGGGTPSTKKSEYWNGDIPWITPKDLSNYIFKYICKGERNISREGLKNSSAKLLPPGTILLSSRAPIGYVAIAKNELTTNQGFRSFITNEDKLNYEFLYYWLKTKKKVLESLAGGSTFKEISGTTIKNLEILLPPLKEQQKIAEILSSLDDKIELNIKMNKTLEEMAKTIFKRWFIDFEFPNEEGKPYKSSGGEFINSELGEIPKGWSIKPIKNILNFIRGIEPGSKYYTLIKKENHIRFIRIRDLNSNSEKVYIPKEMAKNKILNSEDIIISLDGSLGVVKFGYNGAYSSGIRKVCPISEYDIPNMYIYCLLKSDNIQNTIKNYASGTTILHAGKSVEHMKITLPKKIDEMKRILKLFGDLTKPIFNQILNNQKEIQTLTKIRDTLLPKLITGKIRVKP
ncbi:restriction endonuclease subunit S [Methanothermococcus okinawensis]|uniref:Restriction modification system DNA specificity domain protein n=1 Tax=Methanothermococcus okinawensis (strain DSM 14208 / JCM 11175 / IH1) TaxID=647113 RepID=F8AJZ0_METOI|nr:restriction endonuclease subunit S [Methanothermococcus okinawensis]AEH07346.1 restriction modification system DNA specificity domain protein [Methanothermococcus okinawensis IH1]